MLKYNSDWPDSWKLSYEYDRQEIYGEYINLGYSYAYQLRQKRTLKLLSKYVPTGSKVLDVAAAQGNFSLKMAELGYQVTWNDIREELIDYIELKKEKGSIQYVPGNVFEVDFKEAFDCVLITEIIEHVAHPNEFLEKISKLIKPDGIIIMTTPNGGYFRNKLPKFSEFNDPSLFEEIQFGPNSDDHIFLLHYDEIFDLANKAGLEVSEIMLGTNFLSNAHIKTGVLLKILPKSIVFLIEELTSWLPLRIRKKIFTNTAVALRKKG